MISVIVPIYKVEAYLDRCVESIVNQTYTDLEIILVDDGSPDNCGAMCDKWAQKDNRIKVIHKKNGGLSDARNAGLEIATGDYIGFIDSDDWIEPDMYKDLYNALHRENAEMAVTGINRSYDNGFSHLQFISDREYTIEGTRIIQAYLQQRFFSTASCDKLFRNSLFTERRFPVGKQFEDAPVIFDILCSINIMAVVGKPQYHYFQRSDSITGQRFTIRKMDHYEFSKEIFEHCNKDYPQFNDDAYSFWGCKLVEILYSLYESSNSKEFSNQELQMRDDLKKVQWKVIGNNKIPLIMRIKTFLLIIKMDKLYISFKSVRARRIAK